MLKVALGCNDAKGRLGVQVDMFSDLQDQTMPKNVPHTTTRAVRKRVFLIVSKCAYIISLYTYMHISADPSEGERVREHCCIRRAERNAQLGSVFARKTCMFTGGQQLHYS